ncbi:MAG: SpoIIE family protein phosphatase [Dehalococcoidia bacterium]|nr:SpoIIE family protein phosphatase [Dehalococcoidia bacterium]
MIAGVFAGRTIWAKLLLALGAALLYGLLNWAFSGLHLPGATLISLRPQVSVPITMGLAFGPLPGFITGFVGNIFGDLLSGYGMQYWDWSIGNGLLGAIPGIVYIMGIRIVSTVGQFGIALLSILIANLVGLTTGTFIDSLVLHRLTFQEAILGWLLPSLLTNVLLAFAIVPLLLLAIKRLVLTLEARVILMVTFLMAACILGTTAILVWRADDTLVSIVGGTVAAQATHAATLDLLRWAGLASVVVLLVGTIASVFMVRRLTSPVSLLCTGAKVIGSGEYQTSVINPVAKRSDELGELARTFQDMVESLKVHMKELERTTAAKERIESELRVATEIQTSMLPTTFPPFPDRKEFDIFATMAPAREVGGDFYDFFFVDENKLCFDIGDVCGKGIPAALFMAISKTLLKTEALRGLSPEQILTRVNDILYPDNELSMFFTGFCVILNTENGEMLFANGGHNPPLICTTDGEFEFIQMSKSLVVGVMPDAKFECQKLILKPNDVIFMYTDGVTEAENPDEQLFSSDRLKNGLSDLKDRDTMYIINTIRAEIEKFTRGMPQSDDITMMALRFNGKGNYSTSEIKE